MECRPSLGPAVVGIMMVLALFAGCLGEEEKEPDPEPRVTLSGPEEAWVGDLVQFETSNVKDDDTEFDALDFRWDMGDNTTYKGKPFISQWIAGVNHTYEREGTYRVNITVTDLWGNEGHANWTIFVRYQLNMTLNAQGRWLSEDGLNNTTYYNLTIKNLWTGQFDVPRIIPRMYNETEGYINPRATTGDPAPANLSVGEAFVFQVHFNIPEDFEPLEFRLCDEFCILVEGT